MAFHEVPAPAKLDVAATYFSRGAFGDLGLIYSTSGCHGGLHSSLAPPEQVIHFSSTELEVAWLVKGLKQ